MVELDTIIALATMMYTVETNLYKLHPMDEQCSMINEYVLLRVF